MSILFLFLGCFLLYGKSKYFPKNLHKIGRIIKEKKQITNTIGYLFLVISYVLLGSKFGFGTGFAIYLISLSFVYSTLVIIVPIHKNYLYLIALASILLIMIVTVL